MPRGTARHGSQAPRPAAHAVPHARRCASRSRASAERPARGSAPREAAAVTREPAGARHVTLRVAPDIRQLRTRELYRAIRAATLAVATRTDFRIVHITIQHDHIHLLAEADGRIPLSRGIRA